MKKLQLIFLLFIGSLELKASCPPDNNEIIVQIIPDQYPTEISWVLSDLSGNILGTGGSVGDTICIPDSVCTIFTINDSYGDGIFAPGGYWLYNNGALIATGNSSTYTLTATHTIGCSQGSFCDNPYPLSYGLHYGLLDNTWYTFTADSTGMYNFNSCGLNTCDTKIWIYGNCNVGINQESPAGTYAFNDNSSCGLQASLDVVFAAGNTYLIRIGDNMDNCVDSVGFVFSYIGAIPGCMDPTACNYDPMAGIDDSSCIWFPNPLCNGPDLELDSLSFLSSLSLVTTTAGLCDVNEGCVTGYGTRYVLSFTSKINNIGTLDYVLGNPSANPSMFNLNNCHGHTHYEGYGDYRLYDMGGQLIPVGHKNGFCVMDLCGFGQYNCGNMGISAGCYDVYGVGTQCQWIDITDVPNGDYRLAAIINSLHLPDAMGRPETNYLNNALQICIRITRNVSGVPTYSILPSCTPFVDCFGIPGGTALADCDGVCNGPSIFGNVFVDNLLDSLDVTTYIDMLSNQLSVATNCNDLNADSTLTIYDAALANWCNNNGNANHPGGSSYNHCFFPRNITNPTDSTALKITAINFSNNYIDVSILSKRADIKAYEFSVSGITIQNVVSLTNPVTVPYEVAYNGFNNHVLGLSVVDSSLKKAANYQSLCRIYFSAITDTIICIQNIIDIVNSKAERTITSIEGGCISTVTSGISTSNNTINMTLIPNPAVSSIFVKLQNTNNFNSNLELLDIQGRRIEILGTPTNNDWHEYSIENLKPGIYLLRLVNETQFSAPVRLVKM
jgi:hypothetical protein